MSRLADFINERNAQTGKKLSVEQADELIARAHIACNSLNANPELRPEKPESADMC